MKVFLMPDICQRYNDSAKVETLNQLSRIFFKDFFEFLVLWLYFPNLRRRKFVLEGVFRLVFVNLKTQISIDKSLNDNKLGNYGNGKGNYHKKNITERKIQMFPILSFKTSNLDQSFKLKTILQCML